MIGDEWYESEERTSLGMIAELQRIRRRFRVRPIPVLLLALLITGGIYYRLSTKPVMHEAEIVLALTEESLSVRKRTSIPVDELRQYVVSVLLPGNKLLELIERHNLHPLRKQLGPQYAIDELWQQVDIAIWKNSFVAYREEEEHNARAARIGITVVDVDAERAFELARELAKIIITTSSAQSQKVADAYANEVKGVRDGLNRRAAEVSEAITTKLVAMVRARQARKMGLVGALEFELAGLYSEQKSIAGKLSNTTGSRDAIADRISAAGLDMTIEVVEEKRPDVTQQRTFVLVLIMMIVGVGALFGSALVVGAFDARVHDTDDVERLGLPVLGHVPGFAGDQVGSLEARGARRSRVPSFLRWRSHR